jgi:ribonucleoside-diphosphate reductase alpha chain
MQDNVISATPYFLDKNKTQALGERRIGLGVMGLADLLIYVEARYGSPKGNKVTDKIFETIATTAYETSIELGKEKGSFNFLVGENEEATMELRNKFINSGYMKKMPEHIRQGVLENGIRNSHLLTVAPTGSTGTMAGVATGLEPYYSYSYYRSGRLGKFIEVKAAIVEEYLKRNKKAKADKMPEWFVSTMELTAEEHVDVQCIIQRWIDSSISKTVNAPKGYTVEQVQKVYERLYKGGAKGGTVYVDGSRDAQVLTLTNEENDLDKVNVDEAIKVTVKSAAAGIEKLIEEKTFGSAPGDTCPMCREGVIEDIGGCTSCTQCGAQLKCGL